jgi:excisionase family DNA binding protein
MANVGDRTRYRIDAGPHGITRADLLTPEEAAQLLAIPRKTILRWAATGYIPAHKLGRRWRLIRSEVDRWLTDDASRGAATVMRRSDPGLLLHVATATRRRALNSSPLNEGTP